MGEQPNSAKCLGERFQDAFLRGWGQERLVPYAALPPDAQIAWNRAAVAFVCTLSDAPTELAADTERACNEAAFEALNRKLP